MPTDTELFELAGRVGALLLGARRRLVTAESCTGGWIAKAVTDVAGSSEWLDCGYVTYSNSAKMRDLGVAQVTLRRYGAVSEEAVCEMAAGALRVSGADIAIAVSGIAGPDGGTPDKPVGLVWFCAAVLDGGVTELTPKVEVFRGDREAVRRASVAYALQLLLSLKVLSSHSARVP
jgi:nicotinamide-nucleotide amidase